MRETVHPWMPATSGNGNSESCPSEGLLSCGCLCVQLIIYYSSPSLVALEVDSEEESAATNVAKSEDQKDAVCPASDLTCTRTKSASAACEPATKVNHYLSCQMLLTDISTSLLYNERHCLKSCVFALNDCFFSLVRNWRTRGFDCVPIPTPPQKSGCGLLVLPGTIPLQIPALVSNTWTDNHHNWL